LTVDIQQSTNSNDVLTDEMLQNEGMFDPSIMEDVDLDGMDAKEFATMVAETASAFLPDGANPNEFVRRYVAMVTPLLRFGGFEKLTAGMTLGRLVDRSPWIGALICSAATVLGLWVCWPKVQQPELTPEQIEQIRAYQQAQNDEGGEEYA
jgi:hypothetical protein